MEKLEKQMGEMRNTIIELTSTKMRLQEEIHGLESRMAFVAERMERVLNDTDYNNASRLQSLCEVWLVVLKQQL